MTPRELFQHLTRHHRLRSAISAEHGRLYRLAWSWCHDRGLAEDLAQETLTRALEQLDVLRDEARLRLWITTIMVNLYRDQFRRQRPHDPLDEHLLSEQESPEQDLNRNQLIKRTRQALAALSPDQRQIVSLIDLAEFSYADAAAILDIPVGTVMSRLARARGRLRQQLEQDGIQRSQVVPLRRVT